MRRRVLCASALLALAACDPTVFDTLERDAPVVIVSTPGGTAGAFGSRLVGYEATVRGTPVSRYATAGGEGTSFHVFFGFEGDGDDAGFRVTDAASFSGCDSNECMVGLGESIAPFPEWTGAGGTFHGCVAVAGSSGQIQVRCEDQVPNYQAVMGPVGERLGASAAGIDRAGHDAGVAVIGAPGAVGGDGALYRLPDGGGAPIAIDLAAAMAPAGGQIGTTLAIATTSDRALVFATRAAYAADVQRVIVGTLDVDDADVATVTIHACLEGPRGLGGALAWGDLDGDSTPELVVGRSEEASDARVDVYDGADLTGVTDCAAGSVQPTPVVSLGCEDVIEAGGPVACPAGGLGSALAIGDLDADGDGDLVIGAPGASPYARSGAGAVVVLAGTEPLTDVGEVRAVLTHSSQAAGDRLGTAVTTLRGRGRHEILAGAPGGSHVALFACSGIPGDRPEDRDGERGCL